jgi:hypothetical protein
MGKTVETDHCTLNFEEIVGLEEDIVGGEAAEEN